MFWEIAVAGCVSSCDTKRLIKSSSEGAEGEQGACREGGTVSKRVESRLDKPDGFLGVVRIHFMVVSGDGGLGGKT